MPRQRFASRFPSGRIKRIMQADDEVGKIAQATPVLVSKALEMFLDDLVARMVEANPTAGVLKPGHLKRAIGKFKQFDFLQDVVAAVPDLADEEDSAAKGGKRKRRRSAKASAAAAAAAGSSDGEDGAVDGGDGEAPRTEDIKVSAPRAQGYDDDYDDDGDDDDDDDAADDVDGNADDSVDNGGAGTVKPEAMTAGITNTTTTATTASAAGPADEGDGDAEAFLAAAKQDLDLSDLPAMTGEATAQAHASTGGKEPPAAQLAERPAKRQRLDEAAGAANALGGLDDAMLGDLAQAAASAVDSTSLLGTVPDDAAQG